MCSMSGLRKFQCRTNYFLLLAFVVWTLVFVLFWRTRDATGNPMLVHKRCKECMNSTGVLRAASKHTIDHLRSTSTPVYIVEEHHEVLPYWFGSAWRGLIPKTNNVLLHIDGHIDGGPPAIFNILPLFRQPVSAAEIKTLMQENDVFIAGAAQSGLINRFIWVWPPWDKNLTSLNNDHIQAKVEIGLVKGLHRGHEYPACFCVTSNDHSIELEVMNRCIHLTDTVREVDWSDSEISKSKCEIKKTVSVEVLSENKALELSKSDNWLTEDDNIILDIDEDYYGCEAAVQPLYDVGITNELSEALTYLVSKIFCPLDSIQERHFDNMFYDLVQQVKTIMLFSLRRDLEITIKNETKPLAAALYNKVKSSNLEDKLCSSYRQAINVLIKYLFTKFTPSQLTAISKVGLCLSISSRTYMFNPVAGMRLCDGFNRPNETMVVFHSPDLSEINIRTANLKSILKSTPKPAIVTICRSVRDGYTPLKYFEKIESDILKTLKTTYNIRYDSIHYDVELLGGKDGLPSRHL